MKKLILTVCSLVLTLSVTFGAKPNKDMLRVIDKAMKVSVEHSMNMYKVMSDIPGRLPKSIKNGKLETSNAHWWCSGFFPGTLWYLYEYTQDEALLEAASMMTDRVKSEQFVTNNHDVGFQINCSFGNGYRLTGREEYRTALINAGKSLATRFSPIVGCTKSWNRMHYAVIIDNMMNLELLTVSSAMTGNLEHYMMAKSHADTSMKNHFRPDGSSFHLVDYDPETGKILSQQTVQGYADGSSWARGQAWGLYGYTMMYRQTGEKKYLDHAIKIGKYILNHPKMPKDKIPYWDFDAPVTKKTTRDASAAAVMASAYIELSTYVEGDLGQKFLNLAEQQLRSLASSRYTAKVGKNENFILMHSTGHFKKNSEVDVPLSYADYYYVEALLRYKRLIENKPVVDVITAASENQDRAIWISNLEHIAKPVLVNLSNNTLKKNMPVESNHKDMASRHYVTHLEAFGRLATGMGPWLELGADNTPEGRIRAKYINLMLKSLKNGLDPKSPDHLNFSGDRQALVDAAFLAHGLFRARTQILDKIDKTTKERLIEAMKSTREIKPLESNWLLFTAMVECFLKEETGEWNFQAVKYAIDKHMEWYKGDGMYGDGPKFHMDYYNSFVIQPMLSQILEIVCKYDKSYSETNKTQKERYARYGAILERLISPEGTIPAIGRSLAYRCGALQALSDVALKHILPKDVSPSQVRCGMTAVINNQMNIPGTYDKNGWLTVGFSGHQPAIGERYISTGSTYLCSGAFLALGLDETDEFWSGAYTDWTLKNAWKGNDIKADHAIRK